MARISIIIPVYNSKDYLVNCIDSILAQTFEDFEVILVDDGSTDGSDTLCDNLAAQDPRIQVIHQSNGGTSAARNAGINAARGDYLTFVDNDDFWVGNDGLQSVMELADSAKADVVMHMSYLYDDATDSLAPVHIKPTQDAIAGLLKEDALRIVISHGLMTRAVWTKVCSTELVRKNSLYFPKGMRNEDTDWTGKLIRHARTIAWLDKPFYAYRKGHDYAQTSKPLTLSQLNDLARICLDQVSDIKNTVTSDGEREVYYSYLAYPYAVLVGQSALFRKERKAEELRKNVKELSFLLSYDIDPYVKKVRFLHSLIGFNATARVLGAYLKHAYPSLSIEC